MQIPLDSKGDETLVFSFVSRKVENAKMNRINETQKASSKLRSKRMVRVLSGMIITWSICVNYMPAPNRVLGEQPLRTWSAGAGHMVFWWISECDACQDSGWLFQTIFNIVSRWCSIEMLLAKWLQGTSRGCLYVHWFAIAGWYRHLSRVNPYPT